MRRNAAASRSSRCRPRRRSGSSPGRIRAPTRCCTSPAEALPEVKTSGLSGSLSPLGERAGVRGSRSGRISGTARIVFQVLPAFLDPNRLPTLDSFASCRSAGSVGRYPDVDMKRDLHGPATGLVARIVPATGEEAGASRGALALAERPKPLLSNREMHVLKELAEGLSNKQIARRLGISEKTVRNHLVSVYDKLRATNRTHAVMLAIRLGLQIS